VPVVGLDKGPGGLADHRCSLPPAAQILTTAPGFGDFLLAMIGEYPPSANGHKTGGYRWLQDLWVRNCLGVGLGGRRWKLKGWG
jgi:hypothetical protein